MNMCATVLLASFLFALVNADQPTTTDYNTKLWAHRAEHDSPESTLITLVVHITIDRKDKLRVWCKDWRGPMSVSVYVRPQDTEDDVVGKILNIGCVRKNADLHVVTPGQRITTAAATDMLTHYPFNVMRNAALDGARTELVFLLDVDLQLRPKPTSMSQLAAAVRAAEEQLDTQNIGNTTTRLYVVPAFETVSNKVEVPDTFDELVAQFEQQKSTLFYGHYCIACHHPTDALKWTSKTTDSVYTIYYVEDFEPYVIAHKSSLPRYDNRFVGRGWDKMSFFYELHHLEFTFHVLPPPIFLVHKGRGDLPKKGQYTPAYMKRQELNREHWRAFKEEIEIRKQGKEVPKIEQPDAFHDDEWSAASLEVIDPGLFASSSLTEKTVCIVNREDDVSEQRLQDALNWVCHQDGLCDNIRHFPESLPLRADWAFDRWYQKMEAIEGADACSFGGTARLTECDTTPMKCIPSPDASDADLQDAIDWVCHTGIGSCGWTMEGGPHFIPNTLRHHAHVIFTQYYLIHRCYQSSHEVCNFNGNAILIPSDSWDTVFLPLEQHDTDTEL